MAARDSNLTESAVQSWADMISAVADLISAVAWPIMVLVGFTIFRKEVFASMASLSTRMERATNIKLPFLEIELGEWAAKAVANEADGGVVTQDQIEFSARIEAQSEAIGSAELLEQMRRAGFEYDRTRAAMPAGAARTRAMTRILAKMRALGPSVASQIAEFKSADSPGLRLAAIAMMQMDPKCTDTNWLVDRFKNDQPFVFYHAALALQILWRSSMIADSVRAKSAAAEALKVINAFEGVKDHGTLSVLEEIVDEP